MNKIITKILAAAIIAFMMLGCHNAEKPMEKETVKRDSISQIQDTVKTAPIRCVYKTHGTCSQSITFDIQDDVITNIVFEKGCNGNLKAIAHLVDGWTVAKIESYLKGNTCGDKQTSCADQLAIAVRQAYEETHQ
ncbi:MAG: TIGR03905 family TSCPD domain-containing protein [Bacteroidales bacterium]|nr:TIGR03905 family TSCPD domain-containing protein [Bacteroidales bacterium]